MSSKKSAIQIINRAVKYGWTRTVSTMKYPDGEVWHVMVSLTKYNYFPNGYVNNGAQIIVAFRKTSKRMVTTVCSRFHFQDKMKKGDWSANYHLNDMGVA